MKSFIQIGFAEFAVIGVVKMVAITGRISKFYRISTMGAYIVHFTTLSSTGSIYERTGLTARRTCGIVRDAFRICRIRGLG